MNVRPGTRTQSCQNGRVSCSQLILLRHPQTGLHGRFCGHSDPELSEAGCRAIPRIISHLDGTSPTAVWCSDLVRARATATTVAEHLGLTCKVSAALREINFGLWEALSWREVEEQFPEDARSWIRLFPHHRPPGGESFLEFRTRVVAELERLAANSEHVCTLVVTHAGVIGVAVAWVLATPDDRISHIAIDHGAVVVLEKTGGCWTIRVPNGIERRLCQPSPTKAKERRA